MSGTMAADEPNSEQPLRSAQLEELRKGKPWYQIPIQFVPIATALIAIAGFWWGLVRYQVDEQKAREGQKELSKREQVSREREFMKPWLENQRDIYRKALSAVGTVANTEDSETRRKAAEVFWSLYHGEMILVETTSVTDAMVAFGNCLEGSKIICKKPVLNTRSHALGSAMHDSMAATAKMTFEEFAAAQFKYK